MATHPNKHIREAIEYAEQRGWEFVKAGARAHSFGALYCPHRERDGCILRYMARHEILKGMPGGFAVKLTDAHIQRSSRKMPTFEFQLVLNDLDAVNEEIADALYDAGCDDGTPFSSQGVAAVGFSREASSLEEAIRSALSDVNKAGYTVARAESADASVFVKINQELLQR
jgi:hypothetical protein